MKLLLITCLLVSAAFTCKQQSAGGSARPTADTLNPLHHTLPADSLQFVFTVIHKDRQNLIIKVNASLLNPFPDTVYFLTYTCDGLVYDFVYDTAKLELMPHYLCNATFPILGKIPPKGQLDFDASFMQRSADKTVKLGYGIFRVDKNFPIKAGISQLIEFRQKATRTVLIGGEKIIQ